jgi:hypothetical protein
MVDNHNEDCDDVDDTTNDNVDGDSDDDSDNDGSGNVAEVVAAGT